MGAAYGGTAPTQLARQAGEVFLQRASETPRSFEEALAALPPAPEIRDLTPEEKQFPFPEGFNWSQQLQANIAPQLAQNFMDAYQSRQGPLGPSRENLLNAEQAAQARSQIINEQGRQGMIQAWSPFIVRHAQDVLQNQLQRELARGLDQYLGRLAAGTDLYRAGANAASGFAGPLSSLLSSQFQAQNIARQQNANWQPRGMLAYKPFGFRR